MSGAPSRSIQLLESAALAALALSLWACVNIEQPVDERLRLLFLADGGLRLQLAIELRHPEDDDPSSALNRRLSALADDLLAGRDAWQARFREARAPLENFYWEKEGGRLVYVERNVLLDDPAALADILADTPIQSTFRVDEDLAELALFPGSPFRATRRERREIAQVLDAWSEVLASYFQAGEELFAYLADDPRRALPVFGAFFESEEDYGELSPKEEELLEVLTDAAAELPAVLEIDDQRADSLDEISRRVYDPFPARFEVELPTPAFEAEGFVRAGESWTVEGLSLWTALQRLEGRWLDPDPLLAWVEHERSSGAETPFDVAAFAARPRTARPADHRQVLEALEEGLTPADVYRLTWRVGTD